MDEKNKNLRETQEDEQVKKSGEADGSLPTETLDEVVGGRVTRIVRNGDPCDGSE